MEHEMCGQCGFDGGRYDNDKLRVRPAPETWSAIEYAAHTRDVLALHVFGVEHALTVDEPVLPPIDENLVDDAAANYNTEDPGPVVAALDREATKLADVAAGAGTDAWTRGLTIGDHRSEVRVMLEHVLHDAQHHLDDVERGLAS
jgi:hypothetical protein